MAGGHQRMPDLSLEGPFDVHQDRPTSGASPQMLDGMRGCQYRRIRNLVVRISVPRMGPSYTTRSCWGMWVRRIRLDYSAVARNIGYTTWDTKRRFVAALQLQHDAGLILSNVQVLQQFVTSLNRSSSEVMRVAFGRAPFPADAMQRVVPSYRAAHYMAAMGLWRPPSSQGVRGPLPSATCNTCMSCSDCFPDLP